jgi:16S rRNA (cytosine967-C5)-methyltransferase
VQDLRGLLVLQRELSDAAISVLNPGGVFGYATCSPHFSETSGEVLRILKDHPDLEQIEVSQYLPPHLEGAVRDKSLSLWTSKHGTDAMFLALFRKRS